MRERPILFSAPMVRAILDSTKTQTRRAIRPQPHHVEGGVPYGDAPAWAHAVRGSATMKCPYGKRGDKLWVREAWGYRCSSRTQTSGQHMHTIAYRVDDARQDFGPMPMENVGLPKWRERTEGQSWESWDDTMTRYWRQWRPSIYMPRWASRITLEVTEVRVERLQDISEADAEAEGVDRIVEQVPMHRDAFRYLWDDLSGACSWDMNPWVWVVAFRKV